MARFRDDPIGAFRRQVEECKRKSNFYSPPREFLLASRLLDWLRDRPEPEESSARATIILETVYKEGREPWAGAWNHFDRTMSKGHKECWLKLLVVLLQMDDDGSFAENLHAFTGAEIWDSKLAEVYRWSSDLLDIIKSTRFYEDDSCQAAVDLFVDLATRLSTQKAITMSHARHLDPRVVLPITAKDDIVDSGEQKGGQSKVFRIEVPQECIASELVNYLKSLRRQAILDERYPDQKSYYYEFALKKLDREEDWKREIGFHRALRASPPSQTDGIAQCLGSWEIQSASGAEFYLLMEYGWSDLNQYFRSIPPPSIAQHIYDFWKSLSSVISALNHIHNLAIPSRQSRTVYYYVWHGDIKPDNILICDDGIKLTDPGWAKILFRDDAEKDDHGYPVAALSGGTGSYGGPERIDPRTGKVDGHRSVTQFFDIWSLGCVFLETATWVILGARGVDQFRIARKMAHRRGSPDDGKGDDCFHDLGHESSVIGDWIEYLRRGIRKEDVVTGHILDIIQTKMLVVAPHKRISSDGLVRLVDDTLRDCQDTINRLPGYNLPARLESAFDVEQKDAPKNWESTRSRAPSTKPMLDRSIRFAQTRTPLIQQPQGRRPTDPLREFPNLHPRRDSEHPTGNEPSNYAHIRRDSHGAPRNQYGSPTQYHQDAQSAQWTASAQPVSHPPNRSPGRKPTRDSLTSLPPVPPPQEDKPPKFDYYDALDLLIRSRGWVYSSVLEHPDSRLKPAITENPTTAEDTGQAGQITKASTWSTALTRSGSTARRGERNSGYSSALAQAFHRFRGSGRSSRPVDINTRETSNAHSRPLPAPVQSMQPDTSFGALFDDRDIIILVDNSSTMTSRWPQIQNILPLLMAMMWGQDDDGIDLFFTSSTKPYESLREPWQVMAPLKDKDPRHLRRPSIDQVDPDDIYMVLSHILNLIGPNKKYPKKATILILTDGLWSKSNQEVVAEAISHWLRRMATVADGARDAVLNDRYYSIQFVQLGDDPKGTAALEFLDDDLPEKYHVPDVIDVEPANGNVLKMVMGSLDDIWDEKPQSSVDPISPRVDSSSSRPESSTGPPPPQPHQHLNNQRAERTTTWDRTPRGIFTGPDAISEEPEENYTAHPPPRQQTYHGQQQRTSPPVPQGEEYGGLGILQRNPYPYGFPRHQATASAPPQPHRRGTGQGTPHLVATPPNENSPTPRPRRRENGETSRWGGGN